MKKDCIQDFIDAWRERDDPSDPRVPPWNIRFREAGYYSAPIRLRVLNDWSDCHKWCNDKFGEKHYAWVGSTFWFETERDAILFILRWS